MIGALEVTKCLGCGELSCGPGLCPDCTRFDEIYESRRKARRKIISEMPRTDVGVVACEPTPPRHLAGALALFAAALVIGMPLGAYLGWHFGRMAIAYLAGAH